MPVKFWQTSVKFWFFLSYRITTVKLNEPKTICGKKLSICIFNQIVNSETVVGSSNNYVPKDNKIFTFFTFQD